MYKGEMDISLCNWKVDYTNVKLWIYLWVNIMLSVSAECTILGLCGTCDLHNEVSIEGGSLSIRLYFCLLQNWSK